LKTLLTKSELPIAVQELISQLNRSHPGLENVVFVGIQQGGVLVANAINYGQLDITFYRDDFRNQIHAPDKMHIPFDIENKIVVLIDDVLFTGRTIKAALDALLDYGRPAKVELCVLVDRKEHRQFPIQADYVGVTVKTKGTDKVKMMDKEVVLITQ
jgi:pyrimidine operon attenuation protein/uracil phosphoribosyltransferase